VVGSFLSPSTLLNQTAGGPGICIPTNKVGYEHSIKFEKYLLKDGVVGGGRQERKKREKS
jgi:hypothetical protein